MDFILLEIPSFVSSFLMMEFLLLDGISVKAMEPIVHNKHLIMKQ